MPTPIEANTNTIREIQDEVNNLPTQAVLPTLFNPAAAANIQEGYEAIGQDGNRITGSANPSTAMIQEATAEQFVEAIRRGDAGIVELREMEEERPGAVLGLDLSFVICGSIPLRDCHGTLKGDTTGTQLGISYTSNQSLNVYDEVAEEGIFYFHVAVSFAEEIPPGKSFIPIRGSGTFLYVTYYTAPASVFPPQE